LAALREFLLTELAILPAACGIRKTDLTPRRKERKEMQAYGNRLIASYLFAILAALREPRSPAAAERPERTGRGHKAAAFPWQSPAWPGILGYMIQRHIQVVADANALAHAAAERILAAAKAAISKKGTFSIALSGGSTPKVTYALLAEEPYRRQTDWAKWDVYWGDERCVPPDHADSNYKMALDAMLSKVPIPKAAIHRMKGEADPAAAATEYGQLLQEKFGDGGLDMVMFGMGPDGHTLSLFPGTTALGETKHRCVSSWVEKFKCFRITMTAPFANKAKQIMVVLGGADKKDRVKEILEGPYEPRRLPIQLIDPAGTGGGELIWLMDAAAAGTPAGNP
jgi:6-phosphogluconolactonase